MSESDPNAAVGPSVASTASFLSSKRVVYVGGLADSVAVPLVRAAMIPFGNIRSMDMPMDYVKGVHRGFCFVEYDDPDDATEAIFNMDGAELMGRVLKVSLAQPNQANKLSSGGGGGSNRTEAVWKSDEWFQQQVAPDNPDQAEQENAKLQQEDIKALR